MNGDARETVAGWLTRWARRLRESRRLTRAEMLADAHARGDLTLDEVEQRAAYLAAAGRLDDR